MRRLSDLILTSMTLLVLVGCSGKGNKAGNIIIEPFDGSTFAYGDSVSMKMTIQNKAENDMVVYFWRSNNSMKAAIGTWLDFDVIMDDGSMMEYNYRGTHPKMPYKDDTLHVAPGGIYSEVINISRYYGSGDKEDFIIIGDSISYFWRWPVGKFTISCSYEYKHVPFMIGGKDLWEGKLTSNAIQIEVK